MKMIKKILTILIISLSFTLINVSASEIDFNQIGNIDGSYNYDQKVFEGAKIYLYKIADIDQTTGNFVYLNDFNLDIQNIDALNKVQTQSYANELLEDINKNNIEYLQVSNTDASGKYKFDNLSLGLYLITYEKVEETEFEYNSAPTLISLPNYDQASDSYFYEISITSKLEETKIPKDDPVVTPDEPKKEEEKKETKVPNTYDAIVLYGCLFAFSIIALIILIYYINKKNRKEDKNDKEIEKL